MDRTLGLPLLAAAAALASALYAGDARACGGCFHPEEQTPEQSSVVTAHRMALSISTTRSVLWDQVQYSGSPAEFAWVLPVRSGARIEVASDAWFEALDAATATRVASPALDCGMDDMGYSCGPPGAVGCSAGEAAGADLSSAVQADPVTVVHRGSAGPYETVTLHADVPGALTGWLADNGFAVSAEIQPIIDGYAEDGFDFIALRLLPDVGVQQMKPVRVIQPGAVAALPLRMVAAGTGANVAMTLFVIGEGRWETQSFPATEVDISQVVWDWNAQQSNYSLLRDSALAAGDGRSWLTAYAHKGALLSPITNPVTFGPTEYFVGAQSSLTIGEAFIRQGIENGETGSAACLAALQANAQSSSVIADPCDDEGVCLPLTAGQIDARTLACGELDDLAVALTGMHPKDVWLTRLEANLPRAALTSDLALAPAAEQVRVEGWITASRVDNSPCPAAGAAGLRPSSGGARPSPGAAFALLGGLMALALGLRRVARVPQRRRVALG